jgi:hypothetical protein
VATPEDWPAALQKLSESFDAVGSLFIPLHPEDVALGLSPSLHLLEPVETYLREGWFERDFRRQACMKHAGSRPFLLEHDVTTEAERRREPFYQEFLQQLDLLWWMAVTVSIHDRGWLFSLQRSARLEPYTPEEAERAAELRPHLQAIITLMSKLRQRETVGIVNVLERLDCAAMLIDWRGLVIRVNQQAERLIGNGVRLCGGRLSALDAGNDQRLQAMIHGLAAPGAFCAKPVPAPIAIARPATPSP